MMSRIAFPYRLGPNGRTACVSEPEYLRQLLEQIVFVEPGERVNRPDFGCRLSGLTFASRKSEVTTAVEALVEGALRQWIGDQVQVRGVDVEVQESRVDVTISYFDAQSREIRQVSVSN
jgi:phage baseplate assembly protein W